MDCNPEVRNRSGCSTRRGHALVAAVDNFSDGPLTSERFSHGRILTRKRATLH